MKLNKLTLAILALFALTFNSCKDTEGDKLEDKLELEAEQLENRSDDLEDRSDKLEDVSEDIEDATENLEEVLKDFEEAIKEIDDPQQREKIKQRILNIIENTSLASEATV